MNPINTPPSNTPHLVLETVQALSTVFEPSRLEGHIAKSPSRAGAVLEIVRNLVDAGDTPIRDARAAINRNQNHQAAHMLHTLYGSVANLGGYRVCELAGELERLLDRDAEPTYVDELMVSLEQEFHAFLDSANRWLQQQLAQQGPQYRQQLLREQQVQELCLCLADNDLRAFDLSDELHTYLQSTMTAQDYAEFQEALQALNFSIALGYAQTASGI